MSRIIYFYASLGLACRCRIAAICPIYRKTCYNSRRWCAQEFKPGIVTCIAKLEGDPRASNSLGEAAGFFLELLRFYKNREANITAVHICAGSRHIALMLSLKLKKHLRGAAKSVRNLCEVGDAVA